MKIINSGTEKRVRHLLRRGIDKTYFKGSNTFSYICFFVSGLCVFPKEYEALGKQSISISELTSPLMSRFWSVGSEVTDNVSIRAGTGVELSSSVQAQFERYKWKC